MEKIVRNQGLLLDFWCRTGKGKLNKKSCGGGVMVV